MADSMAGISTCCPLTLAEGCTGTGGRWVSIRNADGTVSVVDPATGAAVAPVNVLAFCPPGASQSHLTTVAAASTFVVPSANLESWSVRAIGPGVSLDVNGGGANALADNEVAESASQDDDLLTDVVTVTTLAGSTARVLYLTKI